MRKHTWLERLIAVCCTLAILLSFPFAPVSAVAETGTGVTVSTNASVKQGDLAYGYVYIDSMESLSTLEVTVHFDPAVLRVTSSYNQVAALLYDSSSTESTLRYTYIFDGNGAKEKTQLFYFEYIVQPDAPIGAAYFDVVVGDAYDGNLQLLPVSGSRCSFTVAEKITNLSCSIQGTSRADTSVNQEFTLSYRFSTKEIASGSAVIRFDPELFAVSEVTAGAFLADKMYDVNTSLSGAVYLSFLGAAYGSSNQLLTVRFKTLKNVTQNDTITMMVTDLYDLQLNPISCSGYSTTVFITKDNSYDESAPYVYLTQTYDTDAQTVTVQVNLEANSHLGAGDFVLQFDTQRLAYRSATKGYQPTFFHINDKNINEGLLKFSVISLTDMIAAATMLTATFDVVTPCQDTETRFAISGSGLANYLTSPIVLNFRGCTLETAGHTVIIDEVVAPTCLETGLTEGNHCEVCQQVLVAQETIPALGHDEIPHEALAPTCTEIGWENYVTCSRCDYTTYVELPANGHTFQSGVCTICSAPQEAGKAWDISAAADGSLLAQLYLNHDGTYDLHISGSGAMVNWGYASQVPWYTYRSQTVELRLPEGLTNIGDHAFYGCTKLQYVTLPESLITIGSYAFYDCTGLQAITLPKNLKALCDYAFASCTGVTEIRVDAVALTDLVSNNHVFERCGKEANGISVTVGKDVTCLPDYLFTPRQSNYYCPKITALTFEPGSACQRIGSYMLWGNAEIRSVLLPEPVNEVGSYAFYNCSNLVVGFQADSEPQSLGENWKTDLRYFTGVKKIVQWETEIYVLLRSGTAILADYCGTADAYTVAAMVENYPVTQIAREAASYNTTLQSLTIPEGVTEVGRQAFYRCTSLETVHFPSTLQNIGREGFAYCDLRELTIPENVQTLDNQVFWGNTNLTRINLNAVALTHSDYAFGQAGKDAAGVRVIIGSGVTRLPDALFYSEGPEIHITSVEFAPGSVCREIGSYAFYYCAALQQVTLPESLETIGDYAFGGCTALQSICLPEGLTSVAYGTFYRCLALKQVTFPETLQTIGDGAFFECKALTELALGSQVKTIGAEAFYGCTALAEICLPKNLQTIDYYAFSGCTGLTRIRYEAVAMSNLYSGYGIFSEAGAAGEGITVEIGSSVTRIPAYLFEQMPYLKNLEFVQGSVCETIGAGAFYYCTGLTAAHLPESIQTIGSSAFYMCSTLTSVTLPKSLTSVGRYAFYHCAGLTRVALNATALQNLDSDNYVFGYCGTETDGITLTVGSTVQRIPDYFFVSSFNGASVPKLVALEFAEGSSCAEIGNGAFAYCQQLTNLQLPDSIRSIGNAAFRNCTRLTELHVPEGTTEIYEYAFTGCAGLETLKLPSTLTHLGSGAFSGCTGLTQLQFDPVAMNDLGYENGVFANCGKNTDGLTLTVGSSVTKIPTYLFYPSTGSTTTPKVTRIVFAENSACETIGNTAFAHCTALQEVVLPEGLKTIGSTAFGYCSALTAINLPASLTSIGNSAFSSCYKVSQIRIDAVALNDLNSSNYTFTECGKNTDGLTVTIGNGVTRLPAYLFYPYSGYAPKITAVIFEEESRCASIGKYAFYGVSAFQSILLPDSVTQIGNYAFAECGTLIVGFQSAQLPESLERYWKNDEQYYLDVREIVNTGDALYAVLNSNSAALANYYGSETAYAVESTICGVPVTKIGHSALRDNTELTAITLPAGLEAIDPYAFYGCTALAQTTLPEGLQTVGSSAFAHCTGLTEVTLPNSLTILRDHLFYNCVSLEKVQIPETVTAIEQYAFCSCTALKEVNLPESLTSIGIFAFSSCKNLTEIRFNATNMPDLERNNYVFSYGGTEGDGITVTVGNQVTRIPGYLFYPYNSTSYFPKITTVEFEEESQCREIGAYAFYKGAYLTGLSLPQSVTAVGTYAFYGCSALGTVFVPSVSAAQSISGAGLSSYAQTLILPATVVFQNSRFPSVETIILDGATYKVYATSEHQWEEYQTLIPYIHCQQDGLVRYRCAHCDAYKDVTLPKHTPESFEAKKPDCVNIGWEAYEACPDCDYTTYVEIPALGHIAQVPDTSGVIPYTVQNDGGYPFDFDGTTYCSSNKVDFSSATVTITAERDCTLEIAYKVSSEYNYDWLEVLHNGNTITRVSGEVDWQTQKIQLSAGDLVTVTYRKDSSAFHGEDTAYFRLYTTRMLIVPAEQAQPDCLNPVVCIRCNAELKAALGHDLTAHEARAVSCLEIGWGAYDTCSRCDYSTYTEIPALGHDLIAHEAQTVTCLEIGWAAYDTCSRCDYSTYAEIPALGHDLIAHEARTPNCTEAGWGAYDTCSRCDYSTYVEIPADGKTHDLIAHAALAPTCTEIGWEAYETCSRCDYSTYVEIPALGHDLIAHEAQAVTCVTIGWDAYDTCSRCDYSTYVEIPADGKTHDLMAHAALAPTCTEIGWAAYDTCSRCDYSTYQEIPANGHSFLQTICTACGIKQTPLYTWDASAAGDGSLLAKLYQNYAEGGSELEFTGSGAMKEYTYYGADQAPWTSYAYRDGINRVSLPDGLTSIGSYAFYYCSGVRLIEVPDSVGYVSDNAFAYAEKLVVTVKGDTMPAIGYSNTCGHYLNPQKVILEADATYVIDREGNAILARYIGSSNEFTAPKTVAGIPITQIGAYAFYKRSNLQYFWITEEIDTIEENAFYQCSGIALLLENDQLPENYGGYWHGGCDYYIGATTWTENGFLFVRDIRNCVDLLCYQGSESDVTVPAQPGGYPLTRIRSYSMANSRVKRVVLPEGVEVIGYNAFYNSQLQEIRLPDSLLEIGDSGFNNCYNLREIKFPENLQSIGYQAFWYCTSLTEVTIPSKITQLNASTFTCCYNLKKITLPDGLSAVGHMEFYGCTSLEAIELPENLGEIGSNCFYNTPELKTVYVRSARLAAQLIGSGYAHEMIQNANTVIVPAGCGTDYLKSTYPYCETRERKSMAVDVYSKCSHQWISETVTEYVQCQSDEYIRYTCSLCQVQTDRSTSMHAYEETRVAPTCTEAGYTLHTCADCGDSYRSAPVEALGHQPNGETVFCDRCGKVAYLLLRTDSNGNTYGYNSWSDVMWLINYGDTLQLHGDLNEDVGLYSTCYLDLNGYSVHGTVYLYFGNTLTAYDSSNDDFSGFGYIRNVTGDGRVKTDVTLPNGRRYVALTDENGISFHRMQLQLHTVSLRTAKAGLYYKASLECDETLRNAISCHGVALSLSRMPGANFKSDSLYTWIDGAPTGDFTSGSVFNIFRNDLTAAENAARGEMKIYANAYLQLADGTLIMTDATTGDTVNSAGFDGVAWSLHDVLMELDKIYFRLDAEIRKNLNDFCTAWSNVIAAWNMENILLAEY